MTHRLAFDEHIATVGVEKTGDDFQEHALSGAARSDDGRRAAFLDLQIDAVKDDLIPEPLVQIANGNHRKTFVRMDVRK